MAVYCMSDLHGERKLYYKMLEKIEVIKDDIIIVIGDVLDRGEDGVLLMEELLRDNRVCVLKGNHEDIAYKSFNGDFDEMELWLKENGGAKTFEAISSKSDEERKKFLKDIKNLPIIKQIEVNEESYILVHAGIFPLPCLNKKNVIKRVGGFESSILNIRTSFLRADFKSDFKIVFGHTPTYMIDWEIKGIAPDDYKQRKAEYKANSKVWIKDNKIGIDCGASIGGKLLCLRLDDMKEFYVSKDDL